MHPKANTRSKWAILAFPVKTVTGWPSASILRRFPERLRGIGADLCGMGVRLRGVRLMLGTPMRV